MEKELIIYSVIFIVGFIFGYVRSEILTNKQKYESSK